MTPAVTVDSKPSGLPIAIAIWPRRSALESPSGANAQAARRIGAEQREVGVGIDAEQARLGGAAVGVGRGGCPWRR